MARKALLTHLKTDWFALMPGILLLPPIRPGVPFLSRIWRVSPETGARLLLATMLLWSHHSTADPSHELDIRVEVQIRGESVVVDADFSVQASPQETWSVLTDFNHMAEFISNLQSSKVLSRSGNTLRIDQKGRAGNGLLSFSFDNVREIRLSPLENIRSHLISGSSMKKLEGSTTLTPDGPTTRITYHGEAIPKTWLPPVIGPAFIENETREQFREMRDEILKRKAGGGK